MKGFRTQSNQWGLGFGLRRSTIYGNNRWALWITYGYTSVSWSWKRNPDRPIKEQA